MREQYADYMLSQLVQAVLGIHYWPATQRAAAILWTRQAGAIVVTQAVDFGVAPLTSHPEAGGDFNTPMAAPALPAVPAGMRTVYVTLLMLC